VAIILIISGGNCDQGLTPVEDLPLHEGSWDFVVLSIDCVVSRRSAEERGVGHGLGKPMTPTQRHTFLRFCRRFNFSHSATLSTTIYIFYLHRNKSQRIIIKLWSHRSCKARCAERLEAI